MNWMSVIRSIPTSWRKGMKTSIAVISSYMNRPNYSLSHVSARSTYTKLIQPRKLFKSFLTTTSQLETVVPDSSKSYH